MSTSPILYTDPMAVGTTTFSLTRQQRPLSRTLGACCNALSGALGLIPADRRPALRGYWVPIVCRFCHVSYATRPMRWAALVCYCIFSGRTTLAAVDAVSRSLYE
jgi:hypothetical protein